MDMVGENYRGIHALQLLSGSRGWTLEKLQAAAYDSYQPGFAELVPTLVRAYDGAAGGRSAPRAAGRSRSPRFASWDYRWSARVGRADAGDLSGATR